MCPAIYAVRWRRRQTGKDCLVTVRGFAMFFSLMNFNRDHSYVYKIAPEFQEPPTSRPPARQIFDFDFYSQALSAALDSEIKVINLSIGVGLHSETEQIVFNELADSGVTVAATMGNEYEEGNPTEYPAAYDGVMAVGAVDEVDRRESFSNTGAHIALAAPGVN
jgi:Subtilase family